MFRTVFPYKNKIGNLIMGTEKAHSIVHSPSEVVNYANPLNGSCDGPEGGHKIWVKQQGAKTNQGDASAQTMMLHSIHKEASQTLCDAVQARAEDGEEACWMDSAGNPLRADRWWRQAPGYVPIIYIMPYILIICINFIMRPRFPCNRSGREFGHSMQYLVTSHDATAHSSFSGRRRRVGHGIRCTTP